MPTGALSRRHGAIFNIPSPLSQDYSILPCIHQWKPQSNINWLVLSNICILTVCTNFTSLLSQTGTISTSREPTEQVPRRVLHSVLILGLSTSWSLGAMQQPSGECIDKHVSGMWHWFCELILAKGQKIVTTSNKTYHSLPNIPLVSMPTMCNGDDKTCKTARLLVIPP